MTKQPIGETLLYLAVVLLIAFALVMLACSPSTFSDSQPVYQAF